MKKEDNLSIKYDPEVYDLFLSMDKIREENGLYRINSVILLKALLEEKDSIFYDCLCATSLNNPYKQIISDCEELLKNMAKYQSPISSDENPLRIQTLTKEIKEIWLSDDLSAVLNNTYIFVYQEMFEDEKEAKEIVLYSNDIFIGLINDIPKDVLMILKNNAVFIEGIKDYYQLLTEIYQIEEAEVEEDNSGDKTLYGISDFAKILSSQYKGMKECEFLGRDKECNKIMQILQKRGKKNVILVGEAGVGKTAIVEKIAFDIANNNCPECLKGHIVIQVDVNASVAGTMYRGMAEERFKRLIEYLETHDNVIVFIDEIHMMIGAGATSENKQGDMSNALKPLLASKKVKVIGATTSKEYNKYLLKDDAFKRRFEKIIVKEPKTKEIYPMLKNSIAAHEKFHGVKIKKEMVEYAVLISSCFNSVTHNPDRTNDLIDSAMVVAKEKGKKYVDKDCILENFEINFEKFRNLKEDIKKSTAYHEAGHYLVWKKSEKLLNFKAIAVSIMPAEDYLGVTVYDDLSDEVTVYTDREYVIDYIAKILAGRVAENQYTKTISMGAEIDLENANKYAYHIVTKSGMSKLFQNCAYYEEGEYHMLSEKIRNEINDEVRKVVNEATKRAEEIIEDNKELLQKLVDALMEKGILDDNDLDKICREQIS